MTAWHAFLASVKTRLIMWQKQLIRLGIFKSLKALQTLAALSHTPPQSFSLENKK